MHLGYNSFEEPVHSFILTNPKRHRGCAEKSVFILLTRYNVWHDLHRFIAKPNLIIGLSHCFNSEKAPDLDQKWKIYLNDVLNAHVSAKWQLNSNSLLTTETVLLFSRDGRMLFDYLEEKHNVSWPDLLTSHFFTTFPMALVWTHGSCRGKVGGTGRAGKSRITSQNP